MVAQGWNGKSKGEERACNTQRHAVEAPRQYNCNVTLGQGELGRLDHVHERRKNEKIGRDSDADCCIAQ